MSTLYNLGIGDEPWTKEIERRLDTVEGSNQKNVDNIVRVEKKVGKMEEKLESRSSMNEEPFFQEIRERKAKRLNVVMNGMVEQDESKKSSEKRME
jgi:hypothetical protein